MSTHESSKRLGASSAARAGESLRQISFSSAHRRRASRRGILFRGNDGVRHFKGGILDATVWSTRKSERDLLQIPPAIALQASLVHELEQLGCVRLVVVVVPRVGHPDTRYSVSLVDFLKYAFPIDRGFGKQYALRLERWERQEL